MIRKNITNINNRLAESSCERVWSRIESDIKKEHLIRLRRNIVRATLCIASIVAIVIVIIKHELSLNNNVEREYLAYDNLFEMHGFEDITIISNHDTVGFDTNIANLVISADGALYYNNFKLFEKNSNNYLIEVPLYKRSNIELSDGTTININSNSRVLVPSIFSDQTREVAMCGETFMNVSKDINRKFIAHTNNFDVNVYGTTFNIASPLNSNESSVVLVKGKVSVDIDDSAIPLGESTRIEFDGKNYKKTVVNVNEYIAWIDGVKFFDNTPLIEVIEWIKSYYNLDIIVDDNVKDCLIRGKLEIKESYKQVLDVVQKITELNIIYQNDKVFIK